jgi:hypothetical protein
LYVSVERRAESVEEKKTANLSDYNKGFFNNRQEYK